MIRFLYGCLCLICLIVLGASLAGWVFSDPVPSAGISDENAASRTVYARGYQIEGRHAHGVATLIAMPGQAGAAGAAAPATQPAAPASPRWQVGPASFDVADSAGGKTYFAQSPYWLIA